jgi:protein-S-isoprenylcysteine O-methyltransferase Ste14
MPRLWFSYLLVGLQFVALIYLALTGPVVASGWRLALEIVGGLLGVWAIVSMRLGNFNVTPDVRADAQLVVHGPYTWIRHPMYTSLMLIGLALVLERPTWDRWAVLALLVADLVVKLTYEERLLAAALPGYRDYQARSKRIVPFVY